jgi:uncharacterized protein
MSNYKLQIVKIIRNHLKFNQAEIILFGSRAEGKTLSSSDYDIALKSEIPIDKSVISQIKEDLENSNIPNKIDLVEYSSVSDALRESIDKKGVKW